MAEPVRIDITKFTTKLAYTDELKTFCEANRIRLPGIDSKRGQALALLTHPEVVGQKFLMREDATKFFQQIGIPTDDSIQQFNKDFGLRKKGKKGQYCLAHPFEAVKVHLDKRAGAMIGGDKDSWVNGIKDWWRENLLDVANSLWQTGHLDPTIGDASEANLAYQPPIQARYRNRFKWDRFFHKMWPTATELIPKFDEYYTEAEQKDIYEELKKRFDP